MVHAVAYAHGVTLAAQKISKIHHSIHNINSLPLSPAISQVRPQLL